MGEKFDSFYFFPDYFPNDFHPRDTYLSARSHSEEVGHQRASVNRVLSGLGAVRLNFSSSSVADGIPKASYLISLDLGLFVVF